MGRKSDKEHETDEYTASDAINELTYITSKVVDYENEVENGDYVEWEVRYNIITDTSKLYKNNQEQKDMFVAKSAQEAMNFNPENLTDFYDFEKNIEKNYAGIMYEFSQAESEEYVASLLNKGYKMRRKVLTPSYVEVYLYDNSHYTVRVLVFDEILLTSILDSNELPGITSYFNIRQ